MARKLQSTILYITKLVIRPNLFFFYYGAALFFFYRSFIGLLLSLNLTRNVVCRGLLTYFETTADLADVLCAFTN